MFRHNTRPLYSALLSLFAVGGGDAAHAVQLSPDGRGQVLLYPDRTTRSDAAGNAHTRRCCPS